MLAPEVQGASKFSNEVGILEDNAHLFRQLWREQCFTPCSMSDCTQPTLDSQSIESLEIDISHPLLYLDNNSYRPHCLLPCIELPISALPQNRLSGRDVSLLLLLVSLYRTTRFVPGCFKRVEPFGMSVTHLMVCALVSFL